MLFPATHRYLPRNVPGTGPTSKRDVAFRAELAHLHAEVSRITREQEIQLHRIAEIQRQLDEIVTLIKRLR